MELPQPEMQDDQSENSGGICIEISCLPDGTFQVSSEPLEQESQEETGEPGSEQGQTFNSVKDALMAVSRMMQEASAPSSDKAFAEGLGEEGQQ